ncbi:MAG: OmpA family protein [Bacteroidota bacterium]
MKNTFTLKFTVLTLVGAMLISSCQVSNTAKGGAIGAAGGGALGALIGHKAGNTAVGAIIGAAVGGTAGALIGRRMDKQVAELQNDLEGATVQRVGEGILITFNEGLQFDVNSSSVRSSSQGNLSDLSAVLNKYEDTDILIEGHTDDTGSDEYNQTLSEKRAESVKRILIQSGVVASRMTSIGYGESQPLEANTSEAGRQANRRVEVAIYANEKMKKAAEKGQL